jgi:membrane associated rhomboid family serine protease
MNAASVGHQCPECVTEGRKTQRPVRTAFGATSAGARGYVTISLIVINCTIMLLSAASSTNFTKALIGADAGGLFGAGTSLTQRFAVFAGGDFRFSDGSVRHVPGITDGEYYRLFTAMFMHYGLLHLLFNMWALWIIGRALEAILGPSRFLAVYLICGLGGNVACYVFAPYAYSAGASTAIFGLFAVLFFVLRKLGRDASQLIPLLVINLAFTFFVPGISRAGHIGGLITGAVVGYLLTKAPKERRTVVQVAVLGGAVIVLAAATLFKTVQLNG